VDGPLKGLKLIGFAIRPRPRCSIILQRAHHRTRVQVCLFHRCRTQKRALRLQDPDRLRFSITDDSLN
jgi:hypothetical protein